MDAVAMVTTNGQVEPVHQHAACFDTNSVAGIDNQCSDCISHDINGFDGPVKKVNWLIKGFGRERTMAVFQDTIIWK